MTSLKLDPSKCNLSGKVAIITGGSSGIGLATSQLFSSLGAHVVVADLRPPLTEVPGSIFTKCDVTSWPTILSTFDSAVKAFGHIDIVIANAGVSETDGDIFIDEFDQSGQLKQPVYKVLDINLKGVMDTVKVAVSHFKRQKTPGRIVMTASTAGYMSEPGVPVYSATKHGVVGFMRATKRPLAKDNISINCVAPWMTDTQLIPAPLHSFLAKNDIPVQPASAVALAMAASAGTANWTGKTIYAACGTYTELEDAILTAEEKWLGIDNAKIFRMAQELDYLTSTDYSSGTKV